MEARIVRWVGAVGFALASLAAHACPRNADAALKGAAVGQDVVVNGLPVQIQQVSARENVAPLMDRVERAWREAGFDVKRQQLGPWSVVSALSEECLATLQLMQRGDAVGLFAIGKPVKARPAVVRRGVPLPGGAQVVSTVSGRDGQRVGETTVIASRGSVVQTTEFFKHGLAAAGWQGVRTRGLYAQRSLQEVATVSAQRSGEVLQIVVFPAHGATTAVINRMDAL